MKQSDCWERVRPEPKPCRHPPGFASGQGGGVDGTMIGFAGGLGGRSGVTRMQMLREGGGNTLAEARAAKAKKAEQAGFDPDRSTPPQDTDQFEKFIPNPFLRALGQSAVDLLHRRGHRLLQPGAALPAGRESPAAAGRRPHRGAGQLLRLRLPAAEGRRTRSSITPEVSACPWNEDHRLVRIGVQAREVDPENLPPRNLVFLIDVSGLDERARTGCRW